MNSQEFIEKPTPSDRCPSWANEMILKIYVLEVESGAIKEHKSANWSTVGHEELLKIAGKMEQDAGPDVSSNVEAIFERVARGLLSEKFEPEEIAEMINRRIPTGCNLSYCNASEVLGAAQ